MSNEDRLKAAFVAALDIDPAATAWDNLTYRGIPEWDSIAHMRLIAEVEDTFDLMLETDDVINMSSYSAAKEIVAKNGVEV